MLTCLPYHNIDHKYAVEKHDLDTEKGSSDQQSNTGEGKRAEFPTVKAGDAIKGTRHVVDTRTVRRSGRVRRVIHYAGPIPRYLLQDPKPDRKARVPKKKKVRAAANDTSSTVGTSTKTQSSGVTVTVDPETYTRSHADGTSVSSSAGASTNFSGNSRSWEATI